MRYPAGAVTVVALLGPVVAGCAPGRAAPHTGVRPSLRATVIKPGDVAAIANPGTGTGDPRVRSALLTRFQSAHESRELPGAVVALPVVARTSMFVALRQAGSPLDGGRDCGKWTAGLAHAVLADHNTRGVQLGVTRLSAFDPRSAPTRPVNPLTFTEAVITGPVGSLGDPRLPASCGRLAGLGDDSGAVQPLRVPRLGDRSWAYRVTGTGQIPVWQWVEVVQTARYLLEIRIPNQAPAPRTDPATLLPRIAQAAYARAETALPR